MRILSILTATIVAASLYAFVIEREAVLAFARSQLNGGSPADGNVAMTPAGQADGPAAVGTAVPADKRRDGSVHVLTMQSGARQVEAGVTIRGQTEAMRQVEVRSQSSGLVISDPLHKGDDVSKGDVICVLDPGSRHADLREARARLEEAAVNEASASKLAEGGFATQNRKNSAHAALESAAAAVERAQVAIDRLQMVAPFDGILDSDAAETGSLLQPGSLCARIVQLNPIKLVGHLSDAEVVQVDIGNTASVRLTSGLERIGKVTYISRSADTDTRTFRMEIEVDNSDQAIRDGSAAEIFVTAEAEMAHLIPQSAMTLNDTGLLGVRLVVDGTARFSPVAIIRDTPQGTWVKGLPPSIEVIVVGHEFVVDGTPVIATSGDRS